MSDRFRCECPSGKCPVTFQFSSQTCTDCWNGNHTHRGRPILFDGEEERLAAAISPHAVSTRNGWTVEKLADAIIERLREGR